MKEMSICVVAKKAARHAADDRGDRKRLKRTPDTLRSKRGAYASDFRRKFDEEGCPTLLGQNPRRVGHFFFLALSYLSWNRWAAWLSVTSLPSLARISRLMP